MAWQTLTGSVQGQWRDGELVASTDALELAQLNPGIPIGPIRVSARYRAETDAPARVQCIWRVSRRALPKAP